MGVTVEECEELARVVDDAGVVLQVGTQRRYDPNIAYAADFIREQMGEVLAMRAWYCDSSYRYTVTIMSDDTGSSTSTSPTAARVTPI
jgi:predicted dehydrogenase